MSILQGYPSPPGNKLHCVADVNGPTSYTQITPASPPTGGQVIKATDVGMTWIEFVIVSGSDDGTYDIVPFPAVTNPNGLWSSFTLEWITASTGAQVAGATNLSARYVRLLLIGY